MSLLRLLRRKGVTDAPDEVAAPAPAAAPPLLDRSALLAELEVAVPAPERLVRWDTAAGAQRRTST